MNFQTTIPLKPQSNNQIDYNSKVVLLGSCFSENIGEKFQYFKFQSLQNPYGILFQPLAIQKLIFNAINEKIYSEEDVFFYNEQWHCFDAHSRLSNPSKETLLQLLNKNLFQTKNCLIDATHIIITLGTSWVYKHLDTEQYVANCHKVPQQNFTKKLLSIKEILVSLNSLVDLVKTINPTVNFIFTVSPVRHIKDGFVENTLSKSHLISSIHQLLSSQFESESLSYFPAYEIIMDELRDYRFYNQDMLHPNQLAIEYVWQKFVSVWISDNSEAIMTEVDAIQKGLAHRPFNSNSDAHKKFIKQIEIKASKLQEALPFLKF
ncbi:GSCFA domain-containing protein [Winogradskyella litorisediminis]|uniref:GSCFA domain-containing protein n=1 Tax=Winogradskyella litorisediminis TaxID=1156618 RepID=A0ABW3NAG6_9FLAO